MSRNLVISEKVRQAVVNELCRKLKDPILYEKDLVFRPGLKRVQATVNLIFRPVAFLKMYSLVMNNQYEVAWHGVVEKVDKSFIIKDILVYPQIADVVTVDDDEEKYLPWLMKLDGETRNAMKLHGHSHVDMGVSPSLTDIKTQGELLKQLGENDFYIFMIVNRRNSFFIKIVDLAENMVYDTDDCKILISGDGFDAVSWQNEVLDCIQNRGFIPGAEYTSDDFPWMKGED